MSFVSRFATLMCFVKAWHDILKSTVGKAAGMVPSRCGFESMNKKLVGGFRYFLCSSLLGEMIQFDDHIFQMGWFNHQRSHLTFKSRFCDRFFHRPGLEQIDVGR